MIKTVNKKIAVKPPVVRDAQTEVKGGWMNHKHKTELLPMEVILDAENYAKGDTIWVNGNIVASMNKWRMGDLEFCWVEEPQVLAVTRKNPQQYQLSTVYTNTTTNS